MRVKVLVEFEVEGREAEPLDEDSAKAAAERAAFHYLVLSEENKWVAKEVSLHVDGYGRCVVRIPDDSE